MAFKSGRTANGGKLGLKLIHGFLLGVADVGSVMHCLRMTILPAVLSELPLPEIRAVIFYKRDEIVTDLISCDVECAGHVWTFHEGATGWPDLIAHLSALPGFRADWFEAVVNAPFARSETVAFNRLRTCQEVG